MCVCVSLSKHLFDVAYVDCLCRRYNEVEQLLIVASSPDYYYPPSSSSRIIHVGQILYLQIVFDEIRYLNKVHVDLPLYSIQEEKKFSAEQSSLVNQAYSALVDPYTRGLILVSIKC